MAGKGQLPKPGHARRNEPEIPQVELGPAVGIQNAPDLPGAGNFWAQTLHWYETWCESPQSSQFSSTDWERLHMLAPLVDAYFRKPTVQLMVEIRLNEKALGATVGDRLGLRWRLPQPVAPQRDGERSEGAPSRGRPDPRRRGE